ncbi:UDP-2-acetamido-2,6-beta-L-arabino-hexul-4-ose reductase [Nocardioides daedukensis]|uniref:UDP-2-acetamido-2,6-beta-L-arabino-hexul-4-ose reductase n=1 Tax=Nocardioides daedukensis TaxID=634462 RepID=A0A7Y9UU25_9ACTN|nr:NAD-dependent epimerase/dehydratase family protein [Nocardioides daedukensis]NYG59804.1 UDP-2-acetamido-2,6-beta-L-arabino-hexul-4-ose reductase [Nocardioides daedukensis]
MKVAITGGHGFLGWHTSCRLRSTRGIEPVRLNRAEYTDGTLFSAVGEADIVIHVAGVNRADSDTAVEAGNVELARLLADCIEKSGRAIHVVYANSIQAKLDNPYGRGKAAAAEILRTATDSNGGTMSDVLLPNLFGEHGRPGYNSFVATFASDVAQGGSPTVTGDREIELLHAQRAAEVLIRAAEERIDGPVEPRGVPRRIAKVLSMLVSFNELYASGEIPDLTDSFALDLFNTYRSYLRTDHFPIHPQIHADPRGELFETARTHGGTGQAFVSITVPGAMRGDHYHLNKVERFFVVKGEAEIKLRRLLHDEVLTYRLSGDQPGFVDMPTMWVHNIKNVGEGELITMFWADQLLDPVNPDQFPEKVTAEEATR